MSFLQSTFLFLFALVISTQTRAQVITHQVPIQTSVADRNHSTISPSLFVELEELARLVDISYCVGATGTGIQKPFQCLSRCAEFPAFELVTSWNTGQLLSDSCGYIALSHAPNEKRLIVAFRGTYSIANTIADLSVTPQEYLPYPGEEGAEPGKNEPTAPKCDNCTVHGGFLKSWQNTRSIIVPHIEAALHDNPTYKLVLVGHSLGGAVAVLAGLDLQSRGFKPAITTFGEPRLGNKVLAKYVDARFGLSENSTARNDMQLRRVTHVDDPVPQLPLEEWGYMPHAGEIFIAKPDLPPEASDLEYCLGDDDPRCIEQSDELAKGKHRLIPARFRLWQLFFAHRDYFWRLGLCLPASRSFWPGIGHPTALQEDGDNEDWTKYGCYAEPKFRLPILECDN